MGVEIILNKDPDVVVVEEPVVQIVTSDSAPTIVVEQIKQTDVIESDNTSEIITSCQIIAGGSGGSGGSVFVTDVQNSGSGLVGDKVYVSNTIPANAVVASALTDDNTVTIHFLAEGGSNYSPTVTVDEIVCTNLQQNVGDVRLFSGSVNVIVTETRTVMLTSSAGSTTSVLINRAAAPPEILTCVIGDYPVTQTAVKAGDVVHVTGTVDSTASHVQIVGVNAFNTGAWIPVSGGVFDIVGIVSSGTGQQSARIKAKNAMGSEGALFESTNTILLDQVHPTFTSGTTTYPNTQTAFKGVETGQQQVTVHNFDSVVYSSPHGDFTIVTPTAYEETKAITCTNPNDYNDSAVNYRIVALRIANGSSGTFNKIIEVADVAPVVTITQPHSRLRSSPTGATYIITAHSNQNLAAAPEITIPVSGSWVGSFSGSGDYFTCTIRITDGDDAGTAPWEWDVVATNRAGTSASIAGNEVVGGFVSRLVPLAAFSTEATLNTIVSNPNKLTLSWSFKAGMTYQAIGTAPPVVGGWTIDAVDVDPTIINILDVSAANASSQASSLTIEEGI